MTRTTRTIAAALAATAAVGLAACSSPADMVSENISKEAENFGIARKVVLINGITDKYISVIEGRCNIADGEGQLEVTCRTPQGDLKHFLRLSDNVTYFVEQLDPARVSQDQYRVYFNPSTMIPDVAVR